MTNLTTLIGGGAIFASFGLFWDKIKFFFSRITSIFMVTITLGEDFPLAMRLYLAKNFRKSLLQPLYFSTTREYVKSVKKRHCIGFERFNMQAGVVYWKGIKPIVISESQKSGDTNQPIPSSVTLRFIRGTFDIDKMLIEAVDLFNERRFRDEKSTRFRIHKHFGRAAQTQGQGGVSAGAQPEEVKEVSSSNLFLGDKRVLKYDINDLGEDHDEQRSLKVLAFPQEVEVLVNEIETWKKSEEWYKERAIPWKRGWLLFGAPGSGKTSLTKAIGQHLDLPIHIFDLTGMSNQEFYIEWSNMLGTTPCIALIEDIDTVFSGRENIRNKNNNLNLLTFDCLLNCIDGIQNTDGLFFIVTTNRVELLDEALGKPRTDKDPNGTNISTRPGRIDRALELKDLDEVCRLKIAKRILSNCSQFIEKLVEDGDGDSGAQFQERCTQVALKNFWENKKDVKKNNDYDEKLADRDDMYEKKMEERKLAELAEEERIAENEDKGLNDKK